MKPITKALMLGAGGALALFELWYRTRENQPCVMLPHQRYPWRIENHGEHRRLYRCTIPIRNFSYKFESTVVDVKPSVRVLAKGVLPESENLKITATVKPWHKDTREDGYWAAYILTPQTTLEFELIIECKGDIARLDELHAIVIQLDYEVYSRREKLYKSEDIILIPEQNVKAKLEPVMAEDTLVFPVKTHILTDIDNMADVIARYVVPISQPGDIVVMAESVVAITQRRYRKPEQVPVGFWARRLNFMVPNVGSLSSRYGMQSAINEVGLPRMLTGFLVGAVMKVLGKRGWLYTIAGTQSELVDDVSGTMPPYDKYIVMGPRHAQSVVNEVKARTGLEAAIADVNDLKRAMILAATSGVDQKQLSQKLLSNPLGNASEQTPIVLLRDVQSHKVESSV